ncbi:MAG: L,D-transpeptidase YcbB, partial [Alphaproteobacteria bacterium]|nr:L,D-transpeptidase YcbB [Alphaproteobacteria bacterium]
MRIARNDQALAAALALLLTTAGTAVAAPDNSGTKASVIGTVAAAQPSEADLNSRIPLPDPLDVPPPSAQDVTSSAPEKPAPAPETTISSMPEPAATTMPESTITSATQPAATTAPEHPAMAAPPPATTETATAPAAVEPVLDPIAAKLKETITTKLSRFVDRKDDRAGVESFYAARQYEPLWTDQGVLNARGKAVIAYLAGVSAEGLEPSDYPAPAFRAGAELQALAEAELKLVDSVLTFARHAQNGRVHFSRVAGDILYNLVPPDSAQVLASLAQNSDVAKVLDSYTPQHAGYKALKAKLAELRGQTAEPQAQAPAPKIVQVPEGPILRFGDDDERVPLLRKRLQIADQNSTRYDKQVVEAVKDFQEKAGLDDDGSVGPATLRALNSGGVASKPRGRKDTIDIILANMERWRWMPRDLGKAHVVLNIPAFTLKVMNNGNKIWETRVVVGKPETA